MLTRIKYIILIVFIGISTATFAQQDTSLTREVEVVKSFKPTISDANKINEMPKIEETEHQKPNFDYSIYSQPILSTFSVNTLKAASIVETPETETGYGLVRAGLGNYNKPYGEFFFNNLNSKKSIFGLHAMHLSSLGKITLEGGDRVKAPFSKNNAELYLHQFFKKSILSVNLNVNHDGFNYYGYPKNQIPTFLKEDEQTVNYQGKKQAFTKGGANISLYNPSVEMDDRDFSFIAMYDYFTTKTKQREHYGKFQVKAQKPFEKGTGKLDAGIIFTQAEEILNRVTDTIGQRQQVWLMANPSWYLGDKKANVELGIKTWYIIDKDFDAIAKIAPNIHANFIPVEKIIRLYAGITGDYINNHYSKIAYENPFVDPMHDVRNSMEKIRFYGGFDGKFSAKTNFKIAADYSIVGDQPLYYLHEYTLADPLINPNPVIVDNDFKVMYDDLKLFKLNVEIVHRSSKKLDLSLTGNYYSYNLNEQEKAWNMPDWDANFSVDYKITEQLSASAEIFLIGTRKALIIEDPNFYDNSASTLLPMIYKSFNLDTAFDLNVRGNYSITQKFSVFAQLNNFGFQKYERWFGYPVQSFNFLAGVSYAF